MAHRGRHLAPRPKARKMRLFGRAVPLALALVMVMAAVAVADQVDGDLTNGTTAVDVEAGSPIIHEALPLYLQAAGGKMGRVSRVTWGAPTTSGSCAGIIVGAPNPGTLFLPNSWVGTAEIPFAPNGALSKDAPYNASSQVAVGGIAGPPGQSCTVEVRVSSFDHGNIPEGHRTATLVLNFVGPTNNPPVVNAGGPYSGDEGAAISIIGSASDTDGPLPLTTVWAATKTAGHVDADCDFDAAGQLATTITCDDNGTWTLRLTATDGAGATAFHETTLTVDNVTPTASLVRSGPSNVWTGTTVTYNASATDPSTVDFAAGFLWSFNNGAWTTDAQHQQTYASCGSKTESVRAQDKDGGISLSATAGVSVYDGDWHGAIKPAVRNQVQAGRVVPVQIRIGCEGVALTGLTPGIRLLAGDQDPETSAFDAALSTTTSVSSADTTGFMRETTDGYIYNLQIPKSAQAGDKFTIAVRPWGSDGPQLRALVEIRK